MKLGIDSKIINSYKSVLGFGGTLLVVFGFILLVPLMSLFFYPEEYGMTIYFLGPGLLLIALGFVLRYIFREAREQHLTFKQDTLLVALIWLIAPLTSTIPFVLSGNLSFSLAFFEMVSGWTTTGLSVVDVSAVPKIFLMHRSLTEFFGGVGIVLLVLSVFSSGFGVRLFVSEGHAENVMPNLGKTIRVILAIYVGYVVGGSILYTLAGMPLFDAINHSMAAISTGGFSTKVEGILFFNNDAIYLISIILMILGSLGFGSHLLLFKGKLKRFLKVSEIRFYVFLIAMAIPLMVFFGLNQFYYGLDVGFKEAIFEAISAITTTGFSYSAITHWPSFPVLIIIILMLIGGCIGSTSGGIKVFRIMIMVKNFFWNVKRHLSPKRLVNENYIIRAEGKTFVDMKLVVRAASYVFAFMTTYFIGVLVLLAYGHSLQDSLFEFASAIGTVGLSVGVTHSTMPSGVLWAEIAGMLLGRLEIYVIFVAILKVFRDLKNVVYIKK